MFKKLTYLKNALCLFLDGTEDYPLAASQVVCSIDAAFAFKFERVGNSFARLLQKEHGRKFKDCLIEELKK
jgi:hypothetical protein